jgi:hypothetical protein
VEIIDTIDEIDTNPNVLTTYQVNDYVLRRYPPTKIGSGNPHKYGSWWRGPYQITQVNNHTVGNISDKTYYTIRNLVMDKESVVDVTHRRPFYFDPNYVTPLNVAVKDTDETVVESILQHDFSNPNDKKWLVRWLRDPPSESWERYDNLKNVEAFHHYCATNRLDPFLPKTDPTFSASVPNMYRRTTFGQFAPPVAPSVPTNEDTVRNEIVTTQRKRGRPKKTV